MTVLPGKSALTAVSDRRDRCAGETRSSGGNTADTRTSAVAEVSERAVNVGAKKRRQARVNGRSNRDSFKVAERLVTGLATRANGLTRFSLSPFRRGNEAARTAVFGPPVGSAGETRPYGDFRVP